MNVHVMHISGTRLGMVRRSNAGRKPLPIAADTVGARLRLLRERAGKGQDEVADAVGVSRTMITKYESGASDPKDFVIQAYAGVFGVPPEYIRYGRTGARVVPVKGLVGAGARVEAMEIAVGREVEIPASWEDATALEIRGDSCWPIYEDGDIIVIRGARRFNPTECAGRMCVVETADGVGFVKRVRPGTGPGLYTLDSPNLPPIENVQVLSARPVKLHIPR